MSGPDMSGNTIDPELRDRFKSAWLAGRPQPIERLLPAEEDADYLTTLEELVQTELELAWQSWSRAAQCKSTVPQGQTIARPPKVETYLQRFPRLNLPEIVLRLLQQECSARRQCGEDASIEEYRQRFPDVVVVEDRVESSLPLFSQSSRDMAVGETLATGPPGGVSVPGIQQQDFGNYESLEEIGRGGMGVVYRARQRTADRIVALKVIRRDRLDQLPRDTHSTAVDRFRHEAQAAAKLEHENIVTVYEVGQVDGQPFFSMRYVEGRSLSEILREGPMDNRRAAAYLEPVARAVHEAHSQGILHRDLKPQNILVDDKTDRALVADFGLAKLTEGGDELTRAGEVMGTPSYMSPEQARDSARVTAKTDIYALGATLYHVLTARPPFQAATPVETLRQVMDEEPAPPRQLNPSIDHDLETICLKCLQKEPSRRYDSAEALADDLRRFLAGEPILARPIGAMGQIWRWCRRKPALATAIGFAATFLVVGSVVSTVLWLETREALKQSEESLKRAEVGFSVAQGALDDVITKISTETLLNEPGAQPLRRDLLTMAREYWQGFLANSGNDPTVRDKVALAHFNEGYLTEMIDSPQLALVSYGRALKLQEQLESERPGERDCLRNLGNTWTAIGSVLSKQLRLIEARSAYEKAVRFRDRLDKMAGPTETEIGRKLANSHMNLGITLMNLGYKEETDETARRRYFDEARAELDQSQEVRDRILADFDCPDTRRDLAKGYFSLAGLAMIIENAKEAEENLNHAIGVFRDLLSRDDTVLDNQSDLATCYRILGDLKSAKSVLRSPDEARTWYNHALTLLRTLADDNPAVPSYRAALANLHMSLGELERDEQRPEAARTAFKEARKILEELVRDFRGNDVYRSQLETTKAEMDALPPEQPQQ